MMMGHTRVDVGIVGRGEDIFGDLVRASDGCVRCIKCSGELTRTNRHTNTVTRTSPMPDGGITMKVSSSASAAACLRCGGVGSAAAPLKSCARCGVALYCGRDCQVADWPAHRPSCD